MISTTANSSVKPELPASLKGKRILLVNHGDTVGEASGVTFRLMRALRHSGLDVRMLVFTKRSDSDNVDFVGGRLERGIRFCLERFNVLWHNGFNYANLFAVSTGAFARNIHHHPWAKEADIICLNWINQGLMNLDGIRSLHNMGKKIVWTMHDMWTFTGICHHSYDCEYYTDRCGNCIYLENGHPGDISRRCWAKKKRLFDEVPITFVAETKCLELKARQSALLRDKPVMTICNPFNVDSYYTTPPRYIESLLSTTKPNLILIGASHLDHPDNGSKQDIHRPSRHSQQDGCIPVRRHAQARQTRLPAHVPPMARTCPRPKDTAIPIQLRQSVPRAHHIRKHARHSCGEHGWRRDPGAIQAAVRRRSDKPPGKRISRSL